MSTARGSAAPAEGGGEPALGRLDQVGLFAGCAAAVLLYLALRSQK